MTALSTHEPPGRAAALAAALDPALLPSPPAVATQLAAAIARPGGRAADIVPILEQDPALCAKVLRAVNSCLYGFTRPVASLERAVVILGLKPLRSLALSFSLPPGGPGRAMDADTREFWLGSVTGAVLARDLATRTRRPDPEDDLVAGLLRDLGVVPLQRAFPYAWRELAPVRARCSPARVCAAEVEAFGVSHPEVGAELLSRWHLPGNVVTPIRHHHDPVTPGASWADRAELLYFVECLTRLDAVAGDTTEFARLLTIAMHRFRLPPRALAEWLGAVAPKVDEFIAIAGADVGPAPNLVATLAAAFERHGVTPDAA